MRVLVIDDEPYVRSALQRVLASRGDEVETAADAEAGIANLAASPKDLVIVDIVLPGTDGVGAIGRIRAQFPQTRIIAISGGGNFGIEDYRPEAISTRAYLAAARSAGADAALAKPFETRELRELIGQVMGRECGPGVPGAP